MALDLTKPLCTRTGRFAVLAKSDGTTFWNNTSVPCLNVDVAHPVRLDEWDNWNYTVDGKWHFDGTPHNNDLINEMPWHVWLRYATVPTRINNEGEKS
jgi:hypothetical protein